MSRSQRLYQYCGDHKDYRALKQSLYSVSLIIFTAVDDRQSQLLDDTAMYDTGRRSILPAAMSTDDVGLFSLLTKNIGKDLTRISMPVTLNEPLNTLQVYIFCMNSFICLCGKFPMSIYYVTTRVEFGALILVDKYAKRWWFSTLENVRAVLGLLFLLIYKSLIVSMTCVFQMFSSFLFITILYQIYSRHHCPLMKNCLLITA